MKSRLGKEFNMSFRVDSCVSLSWLPYWTAVLLLRYCLSEGVQWRCSLRWTRSRCKPVWLERWSREKGSSAMWDVVMGRLWCVCVCVCVFGGGGGEAINKN